MVIQKLNPELPYLRYCSSNNTNCANGPLHMQEAAGLPPIDPHNQTLFTEDISPDQAAAAAQGTPVNAPSWQLLPILPLAPQDREGQDQLEAASQLWVQLEQQLGQLVDMKQLVEAVLAVEDHPYAVDGAKLQQASQAGWSLGQDFLAGGSKGSGAASH